MWLGPVVVAAVALLVILVLSVITHSRSRGDAHHDQRVEQVK